MSKQNTPVHGKLLVASHILFAMATFLSALAAVGAAIEKRDLKYPDINNSTQPNNNSTSTAKRYFEL